MSKIVFVCDENLKALFESFGMDTFVLAEKENIKPALEELIKKDYKIIYLLEKFSVEILKDINLMARDNKVSIVVVPDHLSKLDLGMTAVKQAAIDAIGTDAIFKSEGKI